MKPENYLKISSFLNNKGIPILPKLITIFIRLTFSAYIPHTLKFGKNLVLGYQGLGIVIHDRVVIGDNVHINQHVTFGGTSKKSGVPKIGNNVYIGAGAKIIGDITIEDNVVVGANAVVVNSIPSGSLVAGVPAKIIKSNILKTDYV